MFAPKLANAKSAGKFFLAESSVDNSDAGTPVEVVFSPLKKVHGLGNEQKAGTGQNAVFASYAEGNQAGKQETNAHIERRFLDVVWDVSAKIEAVEIAERYFEVARGDVQRRVFEQGDVVVKNDVVHFLFETDFVSFAQFETLGAVTVED